MAQVVLDPLGAVVRPPGAWADTVLIAFDVKEPLGSVQNVGTGRVVHVVFKDHPGAVLKRLLGPGLERDPNTEVLLLKLNRLHLDEAGANTYCHMHAELLRRKNGEYSRVFEEGITIRGQRRAGAAKHEENILRALQDFLNRYDEQAKAGSLTALRISDTLVGAPLSIGHADAPVLRTSAPRRGLYRTYMQMRMDTPDTLFSFELRETVNSLGNGQIVKLKRVPNAVVDEYWGLSDGRHPYARIGDSFVRLDRVENGFWASIPQPDTQDPGSIVMGGLFFGVMGAAIAAGATAESNAPVLCDLDLLCGELVPRLNKADSYAMQVFHVTRFAKRADPITVVCEGKPTKQLIKGEWTAFLLPPQAAPVRVVVTGPLGEEVVEMDTNTDQTNVYLIDVKKDGTLSVARLKDQMREAVLDELKEEDRRK
jgi:hypothetical protein